MNDIRLETSLPETERPIRIRVLGGLSVQSWRGDGLGAAANRYHATVLLAMLAAEPDMAMNRVVALEVLWPDADPDGAKNRLHHTIHLLRRALSDLSWPSDWIFVRDDHIVLSPQIQSDARELQSISADVSSVSDQLLAGAIETHRGLWMPELELGSVGVQIRARLSRAYVILIEEACRRIPGESDTPRRRRLLEKLIEVDTSHEWAVRELMRLDLQAARPYEVLRTWQRVSRALAEELGIKPGTETRELAVAASLRIRQPGSGRQFESQVPLLGKHISILQGLAAAMRADPGLWNICGLVGVGKTALTTALIAELADTIPAESVVCSADALAALERRDWSSLCPSLDETVAGLLVLNMTSTQVPKPLLAGSGLWMKTEFPASWRVLVVTIAPVDLTQNRVLPIKPWVHPGLGVEELAKGQVAGLDYFDMKNPIVGQAVSDASSRLVALIESLDGMPLAIKIAARRCLMHTPQELAADPGILFAPDQFDGSDNVQPARNLDEAFDRSFQGFSDQAQALYRHLAVFPGAFTHAELIELTAQRSGLPNDESMRRAAHSLATCGVLGPEDVGEPVSAMKLAVVHAHRLAIRQEQWPAMLLSRIESVLSQASLLSLEPESTAFAASLQSLALIEVSMNPLLPSIRQLYERHYVRLIDRLGILFAIRGPVAQGLEMVLDAAELANSLGMPGEELSLRARAASILVGADDRAGATQLCEFVLDRLARVESAAVQTEMVVNVSVCLSAVGRADQAIDELLKVRNRLGLDQDETGFWTLHSRLWYLRQWDPKEIGATVDDLRKKFSGSLVWVWIIRAECALNKSEWADRRRLATEAVECGVAMKAPVFQLWGQWFLAEAEVYFGNVKEVERIATTAFINLQKHGLQALAASVAVSVTDLYWRAGAIKVAKQWLEIAAEIRQPSPTTERGLRHLLRQVIVDVLDGEMQQAVDSFLTIPVTRLNQSKPGIFDVWAESSALLAAKTGNPGLAREHLALMIDFDPDIQSSQFVRNFVRSKISDALDHFESGQMTQEQARRRLIDCILTNRENLKQLHDIASNEAALPGPTPAQPQ